MSTETKGFLQSKTIIGVVLAVGAPFINKWFGVEIDAVLEMDIATVLSEGVTFFGALLAVYGRVKATKAVSVKPVTSE